MDTAALAVRPRRRRCSVAHPVHGTNPRWGSAFIIFTSQAARNDPATFAKLEELLLNRERPLHQRFRALFTLKNLKGPLAVDVCHAPRGPAAQRPTCAG